MDAQQWSAAQRLVGASTSEIVDRAVAVLLEQLEGEREQDALAAHPYEEDVDLAWDVPPGPDLPYEGEVPVEVLRLAEQRRRRRGP